MQSPTIFPRKNGRGAAACPFGAKRRHQLSRLRRPFTDLNPIDRVFAKFKHLLRKAAARSSETICVTIGEILRAFSPTECATGYAQS